MNLIDSEEPVPTDEVERRDHLAALQLGVEIERFLESDVGKYLIERAAQKEEDALAGLAEVDPEDPKAIRALQFEYRMANQFGEWIRDGITDARNAHERLKQAGE